MPMMKSLDSGLINQLPPGLRIQGLGFSVLALFWGV